MKLSALIPEILMPGTAWISARRLKHRIENVSVVKSVCLAFAFAAISGMASAAPMTLHCKVQGNSKGWIAQEIYLEHDAAQNTARVLDGITLHYDNRPATGKVTENSDKKLVITWNVKIHARGDVSKMAYRAAFFKGKNSVLISAKPHGFSDNLTSRGTCTMHNRPLPKVKS